MLGMFLKILKNITSAEQGVINAQAVVGAKSTIDYWNTSKTELGGRDNTAGRYIITESLDDVFPKGLIYGSEPAKGFKEGTKGFNVNKQTIFNHMFVNEFVKNGKDIYDINEESIKKYLTSNLSNHVLGHKFSIDKLSKEFYTALNPIKTGFDKDTDYKPRWNKFIKALQTNTNNVVDVVGNENRVSNAEFKVPIGDKNNTTIVILNSDGGSSIESFKYDTDGNRIDQKIIETSKDGALLNETEQEMNQVRKEIRDTVSNNISIIDDQDSMLGYMAIHSPRIMSSLAALGAMAQRGKFIEDKVSLSFDTDVEGAPITITTRYNPKEIKKSGTKNYQIGTGALQHQVNFKLKGKDYEIADATTYEVSLITYLITNEEDPNVTKKILSELQDKLKRSQNIRINKK